MTATRRPSRVDVARQVADTVMYEGYVLFPYRASATKNRYRWQWGVVVPAAQVDVGASEPAEVSCQLLLRAPLPSGLTVTARFLRLCRRQVEDARGTPVDELEAGDDLHVSWDEGEEHEIAEHVTLGDLLGAPRTVPFRLPGDEQVEELDGAGRVRRTRWPVEGRLALQASAVAEDVQRLAVSLRNVTPWSQRRAHRDAILRRSLVGAHLILELEQGAFASAVDPPDWAQPFACRSRHVHPVLVGDADAGDDDVVLAAPIILYDHPLVAPESTGPSFDATEVDELLALAVLGLTDEEKRAARATDRRSAELIDRTESLPPAVMERLHGTIREFGPAAARDGVDLAPAAEAGVDDGLAAFLGVGEEPLDRVERDGVEIRVGSRVRLHPRRRADAHDLFVEGRTAIVEKLVQVVDPAPGRGGETYAAVTLEDDPGADLHRWYGRFQYFEITEVEPLPDDEVTP